MMLPLILGEGWTLAAFAPLGPLDTPLGGPPQAPDPDEILSLSIETLKELFESPASEGLSFRFRRLLDCDRLSDLLPPDFDCFLSASLNSFFCNCLFSLVTFNRNSSVTFRSHVVLQPLIEFVEE